MITTPQTATVSDEAVQAALEKWFTGCAPDSDLVSSCFIEMHDTLIAALPHLALSPAEPVDQWQDITTIGEREHGRLIIVGTRDGKGRWCATIRRATRVIEERNSSITGALKNTMRLKWEPTHFIELTALNSVAGR